MIKTRVLTALILLPFILGSVYFGGLAFFVPVTIALLIGGWEYFDMVRRAGYPSFMVVGLALILAILGDAYLKTNLLQPILTIGIMATLTLGVLNPEKNWLVGWALMIGGVLYIGIPGSFFILIRNLPDIGLAWTVMAMLTVWATDTGAFFVGTAIGKHGFFTKISPKKTWEGAIGGFVCATLTMLVLGAFIDLPIIHRILFGLGLSVVATIGDLAESLIKRQTGVKDSSNIIPGHGGLLDRIDSLLFAAAFAYYYLIWILRV